MQNEERIIELLSEYLVKTDRILDRMEKQDQKTEKLEKRMDLAYDVIMKNTAELVDLRKEALKREVQQEALLKEIFSISKRVLTLEEKKK